MDRSVQQDFQIYFSKDVGMEPIREIIPVQPKKIKLI